MQKLKKFCSSLDGDDWTAVTITVVMVILMVLALRVETGRISTNMAEGEKCEGVFLRCPPATSAEPVATTGNR